MDTNRPNWKNYFLSIAEVVSSRSSCSRRKVGVVIVDSDNRIVATGFNGQPKGLPSCIEEGCLLRDGHCTSVHGEMNALLYTDDRRRLNGATCYIVGGTPCSTCANAIVTVGIKKVVCDSQYPDDVALKLLERGNVMLEVEG